MKTALKAKWVAALRSGEYKQYKGGNLTNALDEVNIEAVVNTIPTSFCCLGVLCDISPAVQKYQGGESGLLSEEAIAYTGITQEQQERLSYMNDRGGSSFKRIATYIEKNL